MRRLSLALLALAALLVIPKSLDLLRARRRPPLDLRDAVGSADQRDLAAIHEAAAGGTPSCGWCHLDARPGAARAAASDTSRWLASLSDAAADASPVDTPLCLSCHDGRSAAAAPNSLPGHRNPAIEAGGANHPVGLDYLTTAMEQPQFYHHPAVHSEIRLESGKVGCTSCHVGHARNGLVGGPAALMRDSCLSCHNL
ncbi:MAG: hypothetical protein HYZ75_10855 [Elusimicrobia bacterium]|nr:hypothetical protein [Elusimicrobiota bacterium]